MSVYIFTQVHTEYRTKYHLWPKHLSSAVVLQCSNCSNELHNNLHTMHSLLRTILPCKGLKMLAWTVSIEVDHFSLHLPSWTPFLLKKTLKGGRWLGGNGLWTCRRPENRGGGAKIINPPIFIHWNGWKFECWFFTDAGACLQAMENWRLWKLP